MAKRQKSKGKGIQVETFTHTDEHRRNIPTAEMQTLVSPESKSSVQVSYKRRNRDLDPQLVWRGKDEQDKVDLHVSGPPLFIQEKVHPKVLIDELERDSRHRGTPDKPEMPDLFEQFNGLPNPEARTEFYQHDQNWSNRMILGDSLQVMTSLAEREQLQGQVQCIYIDPPFGIKFNSNFQWSTTSASQPDTKKNYVTRDPEQVKAFRDTWRDGIHSYLGYLRDRFIVAHSLLTESGSIFVQISEVNVHRVRALLDEVFGEANYVNLITCRVSSGTTRENALKNISNYILWYGKDKLKIKFRRLYLPRKIDTSTYSQVECESGVRRPMSSSEKLDPSTIPDGSKVFRMLPLDSMSLGKREQRPFLGLQWDSSPTRGWSHSLEGFGRLVRAGRVIAGKSRLNSVYYHDDFPAVELNDNWIDTGPEIKKSYIVQTSTKIVQRCVLMTTDPGDIVLDPTCGSGTSAYVSEQWGRRWITIDTSRVALTLARARIMGAQFPYYYLLDSSEGQQKRNEVHSSQPEIERTHRSLRQGFVYKQVPCITLKAIANNEQIDMVYDTFQTEIDEALNNLSQLLRNFNIPFSPSKGARKGQCINFSAPENDSMQLPDGTAVPTYKLLEWEVPCVSPTEWPQESVELVNKFNSLLTKRQQAIQRCIEAVTDVRYLFDEPYEDPGKIRVAGPFTVESLTPHRIEAITPTIGDSVSEEKTKHSLTDNNEVIGRARNQFTSIILDQLRISGVQQASKDYKIEFTSLLGWPGEYICAEGIFQEGENPRRVGVMIGSEHGTVNRVHLVQAAREATEAGFDFLLACAFNYDAQSTEVNKLGPLPILKARMNSDLQMVTDLKSTKSGNSFVIFGEPDIEIINGRNSQLRVKIKGIDLFDPKTGEVRSSEPDDLACWFIDTNYNQESFYVRHAYFLGAKNPYQNLKRTLKAEIDQEAWASLCSDISRPFEKPASGRIAVKAINHLGDEVLKVIEVN